MHNFVQVQISVTNFELARKFYHDIFNWNFYNVPEMENVVFYRIDERDEQLGGAFILVNKIPQESSILLYINTEKISEKLDEIKKSGGEILLPVRSLPGENGFIARFKDPFGNIMGLWSETAD